MRGGDKTFHLKAYSQVESLSELDAGPTSTSHHKPSGFYLDAAFQLDSLRGTTYWNVIFHYETTITRCFSRLIATPDPDPSYDTVGLGILHLLR